MWNNESQTYSNVFPTDSSKGPIGVTVKGGMETRETTATSPNEFDGDSEEFVEKEVSVHDRQHIQSKTPQQTISSQEQDYNEGLTTACWGKGESEGDVTAEGEGARELAASGDEMHRNENEIPRPFDDAYEPPLKDNKEMRQEGEGGGDEKV
jgi:hypothetical protein